MKLEGSRILRKSVIETAEVEVTNPSDKWAPWTELSPIEHTSSTGERLKIKRAARVIVEAEYGEAIVKTTLESSFIAYALTRPSKPRNMSFQRFLKTAEGKAFQNWNKMTDSDRLQYAVEEYASSQGCSIKDWEVL